MKRSHPIDRLGDVGPIDSVRLDGFFKTLVFLAIMRFACWYDRGGLGGW